MIRTNAEIYDYEKRNAANINSSRDIAMNAMFTLRKELEKDFKSKKKRSLVK